VLNADLSNLMAALYLNAILKFDFSIVLLVAEHILSSTVALTNYLQKRDIDLRSSRNCKNISQNCNSEIIFSSSQMGTLQDNSLCFFDVRLHRVYLLQFQILTLFRMLYKSNKAPQILASSKQRGVGFFCGKGEDLI
jgi:hypothetical protein